MCCTYLEWKICNTAQYLRVDRCLWSRTKIVFFSRIPSLTASPFGNCMFYPGLRDQGIMSETHCQFIAITLYEPTWLPGCRAIFGSSNGRMGHEMDEEWRWNWGASSVVASFGASSSKEYDVGDVIALPHSWNALERWSKKDQEVNEVGVLQDRTTTFNARVAEVKS